MYVVRRPNSLRLLHRHDAGDERHSQYVLSIEYGRSKAVQHAKYDPFRFESLTYSRFWHAFGSTEASVSLTPA